MTETKCTKHDAVKQIKDNPLLGLDDEFRSKLSDCLDCVLEFAEFVERQLEETKSAIKEDQDSEKSLGGFTNAEFNATETNAKTMLLKGQQFKIEHSHATDSEDAIIYIRVREIYQEVTEDGFSEVKPRQLTFVLPGDSLLGFGDQFIQNAMCIRTEGED